MTNNLNRSLASKDHVLSFTKMEIDIRHDVKRGYIKKIMILSIRETKYYYKFGEEKSFQT